MQELSADDSYITVGQAAELLGISVRTVERMQADGDLVPVYLPTPRKARLRRFRRADVMAHAVRVVS